MTEPQNNAATDTPTGGQPVAQSTPEEATTPNTPPQPQFETPQQKKAFQALMEQEAALRRSKQEIEQQRSQLDSLVEQRIAEALKSDPQSLLKRAGVSLEDIQKRQSESEDPIAPVKSELEQLREKLMTFEREKQEMERQSLVDRARKDTSEFIQSNEEFAAIRAAGAEETVFEVQMNHYQQTGEWMSPKAAAETVNASLKPLYEKLHQFFGSQQRAPEPDVPEALSPSRTSESGGFQWNHEFDNTGKSDIEKMARLLKFKD